MAEHEANWQEDYGASAASKSVIVLKCTVCGRTVSGGRERYMQGRWYPPSRH